MPPGVPNRSVTEGRKTRAGTTTDTPLAGGSEDVKNASEGRKYLEKHLLLCPPGRPITYASFSSCLEQISRLPGITKTAATAIQSIALLADEFEETSINETVRDAVTSQLSELTSDVKLLIDDAKQKIDEHIQTKSAEIGNNAATTLAQPAYPTRSYANALISPPPHANPRLAAREGIRARQIMLEGAEGSKVSQLNGIELKKELERILENLGLEGRKIRSAVTQKNKGILVEMENDYATAWINEPDNRKAFCRTIGPNVDVKSRTYSIIAYNVPLNIDPDNQRHREEICEVNHLEENAIVAMRWAKPIQRRTPGQKTAHLILSVVDANVANRTIANGLTICSRRIHVDKIKKEPTRCLKCQGWNHFANECKSETDKCGNCTEEHRTSNCPHPHRRACVSCKTDGHGSWSRQCPVFLKKVEECNRRNPENALQFIPTTEPWTWTTRPEEQQPRPSADTHYPSNHDNFRGDPFTRNKGRLASLEHPPRRDTYIPPADWNQDSYVADWSAPPPQQQPNPTQAITPSNPNPPSTNA